MITSISEFYKCFLLTYSLPSLWRTELLLDPTLYKNRPDFNTLTALIWGARVKYTHFKKYFAVKYGHYIIDKFLENPFIQIRPDYKEFHCYIKATEFKGITFKSMANQLKVRQPICHEVSMSLCYRYKSVTFPHVPMSLSKVVKSAF